MPDVAHAPSARGRWSPADDRRAGHREALRRDAGPRRRRPRRRRGHGARAAGAQRRGQTTLVRILDHAAAPRLRARRGRRLRRRPRRREPLRSVDRPGGAVRRRRRAADRRGRTSSWSGGCTTSAGPSGRPEADDCSSGSTWPTPPTARSAPTRAGCGAGSTWARAWSAGRRCCSSTSPPPGSTRAAATSCGTSSSELVDEGTTVLLTTQYLEEADRLADRIAVIDHGRVIAEGTPDELKDAGRRRACSSVAVVAPMTARGTRSTAARQRLARRARARRGTASCGPCRWTARAVLEAAARARRGGRRRWPTWPAPADARRRLPRAHRPRGADDVAERDRSGERRSSSPSPQRGGCRGRSRRDSRLTGATCAVRPHAPTCWCSRPSSR